MSSKWNDKLTDKFLKLYRKHKCLWNPYSPNYRNCSVKNEAFKTVLQELNDPRIGISECLQQIEVIREKYKEEQVKAEKSLISGTLYNSKVPWFNLMSQMLCEVINDEENFIEEPVEFIPCDVATGQTRTQPNENSAAKEFANLLAKPSNCVKEIRFMNKSLQLEAKSVTHTEEPWKKCPSCGWEEEKDQAGAQIDKEMQIPLSIINNAKIDNVDKSFREENRETRSPLCADEMNRSNYWMPETDVTQSKRRVTISSHIEPSEGSREKCACTDLNKSNSTAGEPPELDYRKTTDSLGVISSRKNNTHLLYSRDEQQFGKNAVTSPRYMDNVDQSQFLKSIIPRFDVRQRSWEGSVRFDDEAEGNRNMSTNRYDSCLQRFGDLSPNISTTSEEDMGLRFRIIIPGPDEEDQNLEIIRYKVRAPIPDSSKYVQCDPGLAMPKAAITSTGCSCKNEVSLMNRTENSDSARYGNIIKLNISQKRSRENRSRKRSRTCGSQKSDAVEAEDKSFSNKRTQTKSYRRNQRNRSEFDRPGSARDQGQAIDISSLNGKRDCQALYTTTPDKSETSLNPYQSRLINESLLSDNPWEIDISPIAPVNKFNNTKIFLSVIKKMLESEDAHKVSENLQATLGTILVRYQSTSMSTAQSATESLLENSNRDKTRDGKKIKTSLNPNQSRLIDESLLSDNPREIDNSSIAPVDKFNNTTIFLNVINKMLEFEDAHKVPEDLQTTPGMMLDRFQKVSIATAQSATESRPENSSRDETRDGKKIKTSLNPNQSRLIDESLLSDNPREIDNSSIAPVDKFNNTTILLNVVNKMLESEDAHKVPEDLQTTLGMMLDRFQKVSMATAQSATESRPENSSRDETRDGKKIKTSLNPNQSRLIDETLLSDNPREIDNSSIAPVDKFNNTTILLNVVNKMLESEDAHKVSEDLQTTLGMMLDRFQKVSMATAQSATESHPESSSRDETRDGKKIKTSLNPSQSGLIDETLLSDNPWEIDNSSIGPADKFNNTTIPVHLVNKMLKSEDAHKVPADLQTTLGTMLDRFQKMSMSRAQSATESRPENNSREQTRDGTMLSTPYRNPPVASTPANTGTNIINPQQRIDRMVNVDDTTGDETLYFPSPEARTRPVHEGISADQQNSRISNEANNSMKERRPSRNRGPALGLDEGVNANQQNSSNHGMMPENDRSDLLPGDGRNHNAVGERVERDRQNSRTLNEAIESMIERRRSTNGIPDSLLDDTNTLNSTANSDLDDTNNFSHAKPVANSTANADLDYNDFCRDVPVASSPRKTREPRAQNQLTKDFLDVIRHTMMMDGVQELEENDEKDSCRKTNKPNDPQHSRK